MPWSLGTSFTTFRRLRNNYGPSLCLNRVFIDILQVQLPWEATTNPPQAETAGYLLNSSQANVFIINNNHDRFPLILRNRSNEVDINVNYS